MRGTSVQKQHAAKRLLS